MLGYLRVVTIRLQFGNKPSLSIHDAASRIDVTLSLFAELLTKQHDLSVPTAGPDCCRRVQGNSGEQAYGGDPGCARGVLLGEKQKRLAPKNNVSATTRLGGAPCSGVVFGGEATRRLPNLTPNHRAQNASGRTIGRAPTGLSLRELASRNCAGFLAARRHFNNSADLSAFRGRCRAPERRARAAPIGARFLLRATDAKFIGF
jgi:hypothetical protein